MQIELRNGDCLEELALIDDQSIDLILTDPPYNLGNFMMSRQAGLHRMRDNFFVSAGWDNLDNYDWVAAMNRFFAHAARVLKVGGSMVCFMSVIKVETLIAIAQENGFYYKTTGVWHKTNPMPRNMNIQFVNSTETWVYFTLGRKTGTFNNDGLLVHDFIETSVTPVSERKHGKHPTQKPAKLMEYFIRLLSNPGDIVLDPFMGSGSTGVASKRLARSFIGVELDSDYFNIAGKRVSETEEWQHK